MCYDQFYVTLVSQYDKSALMLASENGYTEIVKHLVEAQASLDLQSEVSWPSYFYIALCSHNKEYYTSLFY